MTTKRKIFEVDRVARQKRRRTPHAIKQKHGLGRADGERTQITREYETTPEQAEARAVVAQLARTFIGTIEYYKTEYGGKKAHDEAVKEALSLQEWRREYVQTQTLEDIDWGKIAAVGEMDMQDAVALWARVREAADDDLECGRRAAKATGQHTEPYALAQFLAIRDAFADEWQPRGGIESAMIDMLTVTYSLFMYWTGIAHERSIQIHDDQRKDVQRFEGGGWKSPRQSEADGLDQAYKHADGYNRQFMRVLRQMRDLRRYAPPVIVNNGGQVNVATDGGQQVNVAK